MFNPSREQARQFLADAWRKRRDHLPATPLETIAGDVVALHPEYQGLIGTPDNSIDRDWSPDSGDTNPYLHMSLHLAIEEQLAIDQPPGIVAAYRKLLSRRGERHEALHAILDCLAETLWRSQRDKTPLDSDVYLSLLNQAADGR